MRSPLCAAVRDILRYMALCITHVNLQTTPDVGRLGIGTLKQKVFDKVL